MSVSSFGATLGVRPEGERTQSDGSNAAADHARDVGGGPPRGAGLPSSPPTASPSGSPTGSRTGIPLLAGAATLAIGYVALALAADRSSVSCSSRSSSPGPSHTGTTASSTGSPSTARRSRPTVVGGIAPRRDGHRPRRRCRRHADPLPSPAVLRGHLLHRGHRGRGRDLPRDHARHRPTSTPRARGSKNLGSGAQLSVRAHRRGGRRLRRDRHHRVCVRAKPCSRAWRLSCSRSSHRLRSRLARMYRGMHHPIDVMSGALIGVGCLCVGLLVARVVRRRRTSAATRRRRHDLRRGDRAHREDARRRSR